MHADARGRIFPQFVVLPECRNINDTLYWVFKEQINPYFPNWAQNAYRERKGEIS